MNDNKTSQPAYLYDNNVAKTIPFYSLLHDQTIHLVDVAKPDPVAWLDAGCGTGNLASMALQKYEKTHYVLADPSEAMLNIARDKFSGQGHPGLEYILAGTENLQCQANSFDVITAIMSHHYLDAEKRGKATANCFRMLKEGGIYVTFESIKPRTEKGLQIGLERWQRLQLEHGKSLEEAKKHISRYGSEVLPITLDAHVKLLQDTGFSTVEVFWVSVMQAGIYGIK